MAAPKKRTVSFRDSESVTDLVTFVNRAASLESAAVRLVAKGSVVTAWVQVLAPRGLNDSTPTVLGMRGAELAESARFDIVVPIESLVARLEHASVGDDTVTVELPLETPSLSWMIPLPQQAGWTALGSIDAKALATVAKDGIALVAKELGKSAEERVVRGVRTSVWGATINDALGLPAGVALGAHALGFTGGDEFAVSTLDPWVRIASDRGDIIAKATKPFLEK